MATEKRLIDAGLLVRDINADPYRTEIEKSYDRCLVHRQPTVDAVEVVHGRWIHSAIEDDNWGGTFHKWTCSNCDFSTGHNPNGTNYCPNCGAKMDGDGNG